MHSPVIMLVYMDFFYQENDTVGTSELVRKRPTVAFVINIRCNGTEVIGV